MDYRDVEPYALAKVMAIPGLTIIDQRDEATRSRGGLPGALPPSDALLTRIVRERHIDPPVLIYCYHGNQSRDLCAFLAQLGLRRVFNLAGGWEALQNGLQQPTAEDSRWQVQFVEIETFERS